MSGDETPEPPVTPAARKPEHESASNRGVRRFLDGWELGLLAVVLPVLALWLALPRPVDPTSVPLPTLDRRAMQRVLDEDTERAAAASRARLPFAARRVGELVRRFGLARGADANVRRDELRRAFQDALRELGPQPLLTLRAVQTRYFLAAVQRWTENPGAPPRDLEELAGNFADKCRVSGWLDDKGRVVFTETELFVLYRVRWTELVGALDHPAFRPTLQEWQLYYRALLEHPEGTNPIERDRRRLAYLNALSRRDTLYPVALARGVLLFRLGQRTAAASAFMDHLTAYPDGPYALRARNYLLAALTETGAGE